MGSSVSKSKKKNRHSTSSDGSKRPKKKISTLFFTRPRANSDTSIAQNPREWSTLTHSQQRPYQRHDAADNSPYATTDNYDNYYDNQDPYQHGGKDAAGHTKSARNSENNFPQQSNVSQPRTSTSQGRTSFTILRGRKSGQFQRENEPQQIVHISSPIIKAVASSNTMNTRSGPTEQPARPEEAQRNTPAELSRANFGAYKAPVPSPPPGTTRFAQNLALSLPPPPQTATPPLPTIPQFPSLPATPTLSTDMPSFPPSPGGPFMPVQEPQRLWRESLRNAAAEGRKSDVALARTGSNNSYTSQSSSVHSSSGKNHKKSKATSGSGLPPSPSTLSPLGFGIIRQRSPKSNAVHPEGSLDSRSSQRHLMQQTECSENASIISLPGSRYRGRGGLRHGDDDSVMTGRNASELSLFGSAISAITTGPNSPNPSSNVFQNGRYENSPRLPEPNSQQHQQQQDRWSDTGFPSGGGGQESILGGRAHGQKPTLPERESMSSVTAPHHSRTNDPSPQSAVGRDSFTKPFYPPNTPNYNHPSKGFPVSGYAEARPEQNQRLTEYQVQQHALLKYFFKGNYHAPLNKQTLGSILDVGCGMGLWMRDMAQEFPLTEIHGIDKVIPTRRRRPKTGDSMPGSTPPISPLFSGTRKHPSSVPSSPSLAPEATFDYTGQPMDSPMPSNCFFHKADIAMGLPFPDNTFDYCHVRLVLWGYPLNSFPDLLNELIRITKTGGWIEFVDMDPCILKATETGTCINEWIKTGLIHRNMDPDLVKGIPRFLREFQEATMRSAQPNNSGTNQGKSKSRGSLILPTLPFGLEKLTVSKISLPFGPWGGQIGEQWQQTFTTFLKGLEPMMVDATLAGLVMDQYHRKCQQEMLQHKEGSIDPSDQELCTRMAWQHLIQQLVKDALVHSSTAGSMTEMRSYNNFYIAYAQKASLVELQQQQLLLQLEQEILSPNPNSASSSMFPWATAATLGVQPRQQGLSSNPKGPKQQRMGHLYGNLEQSKQSKQLASTLRERLSAPNLHQRHAHVPNSGSLEGKLGDEGGWFDPRNKNRYGVALTVEELESIHRAGQEARTRHASPSSPGLAPTAVSIAGLSIGGSSRNSDKSSGVGGSVGLGVSVGSHSHNHSPSHSPRLTAFGGSRFQGAGPNRVGSPLIPLGTSPGGKGSGSASGSTAMVLDYFNQAHPQHSPLYQPNSVGKKTSQLSQEIIPEARAAAVGVERSKGWRRHEGVVAREWGRVGGRERHVGYTKEPLTSTHRPLWDQPQQKHGQTKVQEKENRESSILIALEDSHGDDQEEQEEGGFEMEGTVGTMGRVPEHQVRLSVVGQGGQVVPMEWSSALVEESEGGDKQSIEIVNGIPDKAGLSEKEEKEKEEEAQLQMLQVPGEEEVLVMMHEGARDEDRHVPEVGSGRG
ncbi:MAG: hypothetical protein J3Q66DRAFT_323644 [Benniella sp.]|nr:MAG: hypothetical protein J3Q66DRAFT_323644 [Benniella sp.]